MAVRNSWSGGRLLYLTLAIRELNHRMNIPDTLPGIIKEDIPKMAKHAAKEANPLYPVPVLMNAKELEKFYYKIADGR